MLLPFNEFEFVDSANLSKKEIQDYSGRRQSCSKQGVDSVWAQSSHSNRSYLPLKTFSGMHDSIAAKEVVDSRRSVTRT